MIDTNTGLDFGRRETLLAKADESRREWIRTENAEGEVDQLRARVKELESLLVPVHEAPDEVVKAVRWTFGVSDDELCGPDRITPNGVDLVLVRCVAVGFLREELKLSYCQMKAPMGKTCHSIMHHQYKCWLRLPETDRTTWLQRIRVILNGKLHHEQNARN